MYDLIFTSLAKHPSITQKHVHTGWEMVYYLDCLGKFYVEDRCYNFEHGSIFVIPPGLSHYEISESDMTIACFCVETFYCLEKRVYSFKDNLINDFSCLFRQLHAVNNMKPPNWERIKDGLLNVIEQYVISWNFTGYENSFMHYFKYQLTEAISEKNIDMEEMIKKIPVSSSYFRKLFKAETGKSPMQYLQDQRIENAKRFLSNSNMSVKNIANLVGYCDQYYFSRIFKKAAGICPTEWREKN